MTTNVLILCTGNSARSIIGEALVSALDGFGGYSAGSTPKGHPHPMALSVLAAHGHDVSGFSSKRWDVFAGPGAPEMHAIITVCDNAAGEVCPVWPGHPVQAHWGLPDPAAVEGAGQREAFEQAYVALTSRISSLPAIFAQGLTGADLKRAIQAVHDAV